MRIQWNRGKRRRREYRRDSRETTALLRCDEVSQSLVSMELKFSRGPKAEHGFVFHASCLAPLRTATLS